jgi:hypothetical protein
MSLKMKILAGTAGLAAAVGVATPAAAQYYPQPGYGYPGNQGGGVLGAIVNQVFGYGQYPYGNYGYNQGYGNQRQAIDQCARYVESRLNGGGYGNWGYNGWNGQYDNRYGGGYDNRYGGGYNNRYGGGGRVLGITRVERKSYGLKVSGVASSGYNGYDGYNRNGYGTYGYSQGADLSFTCKVEYNGRIRDIDVKRRTAYWRGY